MLYCYISNYSYIFLANYNIKSQEKCAIIAAYLDLTTLETKLYEKEGQAGKQS